MIEKMTPRGKKYPKENEKVFVSQSLRWCSTSTEAEEGEGDYSETSPFEANFV
jgi:hypothetical protein